MIELSSQVGLKQLNYLTQLLFCKNLLAFFTIISITDKFITFVSDSDNSKTIFIIIDNIIKFFTNDIVRPDINFLRKTFLSNYESAIEQTRLYLYILN